MPINTEKLTGISIIQHLSSISHRMSLLKQANSSMYLYIRLLWEKCFARCHDVTSCWGTRGKQGDAKTVQDDNVGQQLTRHPHFQGFSKVLT